MLFVVVFVLVSICVCVCVCVFLWCVYVCMNIQSTIISNFILSLFSSIETQTKIDWSNTMCRHHFTRNHIQTLSISMLHNIALQIVLLIPFSCIDTTIQIQNQTVRSRGEERVGPNREWEAKKENRKHLHTTKWKTPKRCAYFHISHHHTTANILIQSIGSQLPVDHKKETYIQLCIVKRQPFWVYFFFGLC